MVLQLKVNAKDLLGVTTPIQLASPTGTWVTLVMHKISVPSTRMLHPTPSLVQIWNSAQLVLIVVLVRFCQTTAHQVPTAKTLLVHPTIVCLVQLTTIVLIMVWLILLMMVILTSAQMVIYVLVVPFILQTEMTWPLNSVPLVTIVHKILVNNLALKTTTTQWKDRLLVHHALLVSHAWVPVIFYLHPALVVNTVFYTMIPIKTLSIMVIQAFLTALLVTIIHSLIRKLNQIVFLAYQVTIVKQVPFNQPVFAIVVTSVLLEKVNLIPAVVSHLAVTYHLVNAQQVTTAPLVQPIQLNVPLVNTSPTPDKAPAMNALKVLIAEVLVLVNPLDSVPKVSTVLVDLCMHSHTMDRLVDFVLKVTTVLRV